jgi:hypothetical protein
MKNGFSRFRLTVAAASIAAIGSAALGQSAAPDAPAQVKQVFQQIGFFKAAIAEAFASTGKFPGNLKDAGVDAAPSIAYATVRLGSEGVINIRFNEQADPSIRGKVAKVVPMSSDVGDVIFYCLAPQLPEEIRPPGCR